MLSKNSFFNGTIFKNTLLTSWPVWGLASFIGCLFPIGLLFALMGGNADISDFSSYIYCFAFAFDALPIVSTIYALIVSLIVWGYLNQTRHVGFIHSLPVKRTALFITNFTSGIAMFMIPYLLMAILFVLVMGINGHLMIAPVLITLALCLCESIIFFSIATFFAMISGSGKMSGFLYAFVMLFPLAANSLASAILDRFLFGFGNDYDTNLSYISPVVHIMDRVSASLSGNVYPLHEHIIYYGMDVLIWTFAASIVILILSFFIYQRRPSESAANVFCFGIINPIFHYFIMMLSAIIFGPFIYNLLFDSLWNTEYFKLLPIIGCMFVAGLIGYFVAKMITQKSFRVFKRAYIPILITVAFATLFCLTFSMDFTGVQGRVPDRTKIEAVDLRLNSDYMVVFENDNPELVDEIRDLHLYIVDHANEYKKNSSSSDSLDTHSYVSFAVTYILRSGKTLSRSYEFYVLKDSFDDPGSFGYLAREFANSKSYLRHLYYLDQDVSFSNTSIDVRAAKGHKSSSYSISPSDSAELRSAISKDIDEGTVINYDFDRRYDDSSIQYFVDFSDYSEFNYYHLNTYLYVNKDMLHSMEYLSHLDELKHYDPLSSIQIK